MDTAQKIAELESKLKEAEEKYKFRLSRFRGVPHESASGELSYSDLKVAEDYVQSLKDEIEALKRQNSGTLNDR